MYSENGVLVDFDEINKLVNTADVFTVAFANFPERLIVDTRSNGIETPMVQVVRPEAGLRFRAARVIGGSRSARGPGSARSPSSCT